MARKDWLDRAFDLHARSGSTFQAEREEAQRQLVKLLNSKGRTWNDLPELPEVVRKRRAPPIPPQASAPPPPTGEPLAGRDLFNGIRAVLRQYLSLEEDEYVVITLWAMHTYVCRRFMHTPRLLLSSALRGCGKTTGLDFQNVATTFRTLPQWCSPGSAACRCRWPAVPWSSTSNVIPKPRSV